MVFLILVIGVLNVCLGFVLAVRLGYGPPGLMEAWEALTAEPLGGLAGELAATPLEQMLDDEPDELYGAPDVEAYDDWSKEPDQPTGTEEVENWNLDEKYVETSLLKLNIAMMKSGARATEIDTRLRACLGKSDLETVGACLAQLKEDCETYLNEQAEAAKKLSERVGELGELSSLGQDIEMANLEQSAQVETTLNNLGSMDFASDPDRANRKLLEEIGNLRMARHKLRDYQEAAFLAIARYEDRLGAIEERLFDDPLTRLHNRIGLEVTLWRWWQQKRHESRQMNAVLFDLDDFGDVNEEHGLQPGDRILYHLARLMEDAADKADLVARVGGQRFMMVMLDVGPRTATKNAEQIRQSIEKLKFTDGDREIRVTVSSGLTEVQPSDTSETVFERLEDALKKAVGAGGNQAFFHDGAEPEPVDPPNFAPEEIEIRI